MPMMMEAKMMRDPITIIAMTHPSEMRLNYLKNKFKLLNK